MPRRSFHRAALYIALGVLVASLTGVAYVGIGFLRQEAVLSQIAGKYPSQGASATTAILANNEYVSRLENFEQNRARFFGLLGPTPLNVVEDGGWCSDRSRLLAALLNKIGVPAHVVMLRPCQECPANHTVVEAFTGDFWMAVDPTYGLVYSKLDGTYASIEDLAKNSELLHDTEDSARAASYDPLRYSYEYPLRMNFDRDPFTRLFGAMLTLFVERLESVRRPQLLERPRLLVLVGLAATIGFAILVCLVSGYQLRYRSRV